MAKCGLCCGGKTTGAYIAIIAGISTASYVALGNRDDDKKPVQTPSTTPATPDASKTPAAKPGDEKKSTDEAKVDAAVLDFTMKDIEGKDKSLADFKGSVVLMVNVASECGFTHQYAGLESLYASKKDSGLVILGFPANNFGGQEPGSEADIKKVCYDKYKATFPMFSKVSVKGDDICPLYKKLTAQPEPIGGDVPWNFTKYLVDRKGNVVAKYTPRVKPDDTEMLRKIDELLAQK